MRWGVLCLWAVALWGGLAAAAEPRPELRLVDAGWGVVQAVADHRTLVLADGRTVRLSGIGAFPGPAIQPENPGRLPRLPLSSTAKEALGQLVLGRSVRLWFSGTRFDRYGQLLAQVYDDQDRWIQGALVAQGLARVESVADNRGLIQAMQEIEDVARAARLGMWSDPYYAVRAPEETRYYLNRFEIVEGRVLAADEVNGRIYLNFGSDWRTDFTVAIAPADVRDFRKEGVDLLRLSGQRVRVRGWIRSYNGPLMDVTHPEQIQLLGP